MKGTHELLSPGPKFCFFGSLYGYLCVVELHSNPLLGEIGRIEVVTISLKTHLMGSKSSIILGLTHAVSQVALMDGTFDHPITQI